MIRCIENYVLDHGPWTMVHDVHGPWSMVHGPRFMDHCPWTMVLGPFASTLIADNCYSFEGVSLCYSRRPSPGAQVWRFGAAQNQCFTLASFKFLDRPVSSFIRVSKWPKVDFSISVPLKCLCDNKPRQERKGTIVAKVAKNQGFTLLNTKDYF